MISNSHDHYATQDENIDAKNTVREHQLRVVFNSFDTNFEGHLDLRGLVAALKELGVTSCLYTTRRILEAMDLNKSGLIEFDDFHRFFKRANDIDEMKHILSSEALKMVDYLVDAGNGDPNFSMKYRIPECHRPEKHFQFHMDVVQSVVRTEANRFVSGSLDGFVAVWDQDSQPVGSFKPTGASVYSISSLAESFQFLVGHSHSEKALNIIDIDERRIVHEFNVPGHHSVTSTDAFLTKAVAGLKSGSCLLFDVSRHEHVSILTEADPVIESVAINTAAHGNILAAGDHLGIVTIIDMKSNKFLNKFEGSLGHLSCVRWIGEFELLTGGDDFIVRRFDIRKVTPSGGSTGALLGHSSPITSLEALSYQGETMVFSGSRDGSVRIWSLDPHVNARKGGNVKFQQANEDMETSSDTSVSRAALIGHSQAVKATAAKIIGSSKISVLTGSSDTTINEYLVDC